MDRTPKMTRWFPLSANPVRRGWYEYSGEMIDHGMRLYWNGWQWGYWMVENTMVKNNWVHYADSKGDKWRGLTQDAARRLK